MKERGGIGRSLLGKLSDTEQWDCRATPETAIQRCPPNNRYCPLMIAAPSTLKSINLPSGMILALTSYSSWVLGLTDDRDFF